MSGTKWRLLGTFRWCVLVDIGSKKKRYSREEKKSDKGSYAHDSDCSTVLYGIWYITVIEQRAFKVFSTTNTRHTVIQNQIT